MKAYLSTDIAELGAERKDHIILLPQWTLADRIPKLVNGLNFNLGILGQCSLGNLRELCEDEEDGDSGAEACHSQINILHVCQVVCILSCKEELGSDQRADERRDTVP